MIELFDSDYENKSQNFSNVFEADFETDIQFC